VEAPKTFVWTKENLVDLATTVAEEHHLNTDRFLKVIRCESNWIPTAKGDDGNSRGLVQISSIYHPEVSDEEADDPKYALEFMAKEWDRGHQRQWSCYRLLN